jgi:hypothetical protein
MLQKLEQFLFCNLALSLHIINTKPELLPFARVFVDELFDSSIILLFAQAAHPIVKIRFEEISD